MSERNKPFYILTRHPGKKYISIVLALALVVLNNVGKESIDEEYEMIDAREPIIVEFPLRGEWLSPNTPGTKIPSHGTNQLGSRYAFDFIQVDWERKGRPAYCVNLLRYLLFGVPLNKYYCWSQEVYAPCNGVIVQVEDGYKERTRTNLLLDISGAYKNAHYFNPEKDDIRIVAGNYIIMEIDDNVYAAFAHLQTGSIQVSIDQSVKKGDVIGKIGNSGNSFGPHLHFQLMDSRDIVTAKGLPCAFEKYEIFKDGEWQEVVNGIPKDKDRIRFSNPVSKQ